MGQELGKVQFCGSWLNQVPGTFDSPAFVPVSSPLARPFGPNLSV